MRIYIAGPMRGRTDYNYPAFMEAERILVAEGWEVVNPAAIDLAHGFDPSTPCSEITKKDLLAFMKRDIKLIESVDAICLLDEFETSKGAMVEKAMAEYLSLPVYKMSREGEVRR